MSCISKILELKGDKDFIYSSDRKNVAIEGGGKYKDYEYLIVFTSGGHRCGYVAIASDHPANKWEDNLDIKIDCHGGITFAKRDHHAKELLGKNYCDDLWLGFDCAHICDRYDLENVEKYFGKERMNSLSEWDHAWEETASVRDFSYVEKECKSVIDQLIQLESVMS